MDKILDNLILFVFAVAFFAWAASGLLAAINKQLREKQDREDEQKPPAM